jgi:hypothetical protein
VGPSGERNIDGWRTRSTDLARYVRSDDFTAVLSLLDLAAAPPVLEFQCAGQRRGLDYVAELHGAQSPANP